MSEKKLSPEGELMYRIIENWGNAIAMPHMEGWIKEYGDARVKAQQGAVWGKASEPPTHERYVPIRFADGTYKVAAFTTDHMFKERQPFWMYSRHDHVSTLLEFEWYDESGTPAAARDETLQRIKDFNLSDIDAPVFTHTKEFQAHFSYIKGKLMDMLGVGGTRREEDAVQFAEWAPTIAFFYEDTRLWELLREGEFINGQFRFTTKELYELFKQQKEK